MARLESIGGKCVCLEGSTSLPPLPGCLLQSSSPGSAEKSEKRLGESTFP